MSNSTPVPKDMKKKKKPSAPPPSPPPPPHEEPQSKRPQTPPDSPKSSAASHVVKNLIAPPMTPPPNQTQEQRATPTTPPPAPRPSRKRAVSEVSSDLCPRQTAIRNVRRRLFVDGANDDKGQGGVVGKVSPVHVAARGGDTPLTGPDQQRRCFVDVHRAVKRRLEESVL
ncbi:hypothetical protein BKA81DRAFT_382881 [Phyllosticta paracitricarpa]